MSSHLSTGASGWGPAGGGASSRGGGGLSGGHWEWRQGGGLLVSAREVGDGLGAYHLQASKVVPIHQLGVEHALDVVHSLGGLSHVQAH